MQPRPGQVNLLSSPIFVEGVIRVAVLLEQWPRSVLVSEVREMGRAVWWEVVAAGSAIAGLEIVNLEEQRTRTWGAVLRQMERLKVHVRLQIMSTVHGIEMGG